MSFICSATVVLGGPVMPAVRPPKAAHFYGEERRIELTLIELTSIESALLIIDGYI